MAVMHTTLWGASGSFGMQEASAMARKASRELQRAENAAETDDRVDAAINCAITAWHMTDWCWNGITATNRNSQEVARYIGAVTPLKKSDLVAWAIRECPELELCQSICNGSKHVKSERLIQTQARHAGDDPTSVAALTITDGPAERDAIEVLRAAVWFWGRQATNDSEMR
ncbi:MULTISPECIES: hypothetical protein [unclassified Brevundimonas]|uniref:hypothetical protein n=1 Tax=unclassified Brevundimonas TaxID=2622653 RepID=UPI0025C09047|nr:MULTISPECIES: hypothetical protein [unclassified Brevundimonas]